MCGLLCVGLGGFALHRANIGMYRGIVVDLTIISVYLH